MPRNSTSVSTKRERIAELAKQSPQMAFTSLAYLIDREQQQKLNEKLHGHYAYYGVTGNSGRLPLQVGGRALLAEVAQSPQSPAVDDLRDVPTSPQAIPADPRSHFSLNLRPRSEPMT